MTFAITVLFELKPRHREGFLGLMRENAALSLRDEPGCLHFDVLLPEGDEDNVFLYEIYIDEAAFDAHRQASHFLSFDKATSEMVVAKTVKRFACLDGLDLRQVVAAPKRDD